MGPASVQPSERAHSRPTVKATWPRLLVVGAVLVLAFVVAQTCQKEQVRVSKEQAIATAERQVEFEPTRTQVRLLRQGIQSRPFWIVSLSVPVGDFKGDRFSKLAVVRIDANTGKVDEVKGPSAP